MRWEECTARAALTRSSPVGGAIWRRRIGKQLRDLVGLERVEVERLPHSGAKALVRSILGGESGADKCKPFNTSDPGGVTG